MPSRAAAAPTGARPRRALAIPPPGPAAGRVGPWQLDEALGPGTFAGTEAATGAPVVVKVAAADDPAAARLRREAAALRSLGGGDHPALVAAAGDHDDGGVVAVASRRIEGTPLDALLRDRGSLPFADAAHLLAPVADAVAGLHRRGWVHGDISPANVVVGVHGAVLVDLGAAHPCGAPTEVEATPATAAPEVRRGLCSTTPAGDVWALAALVAVAVTGEPPTHGSPLPAPVALGLRRALADDPDERPAATELAAALAAVGRDGVAPVATTARSLPRDERTTRDFGPRPLRATVVVPAGRRRRWWWPVLLVALVLGAGLGWRRGTPRPAPVPPEPVAARCPAVAPLAGGRLTGDVDGDGCADAAGWRDGVLTVRAAAGGPLRRFVLGADGAVALGDWDGDGIATPAVTDPTTGTVIRYDAWP